MKNVLKGIFLCAIFMVLPVTRLFCEQEQQDFLKPGFNIRLGIGYLGASGGITRIWKDGGEADFSLGYRFLKNFGIEGGGIVGITGMQDEMKNTVHGYYEISGAPGQASSTGGTYMAWFIGPKYYYLIPNRVWVLSLGTGFYSNGEFENGMDNVKNYGKRWTSGDGYYFCFGAHKIYKKSVVLGIQVKYSRVKSEVNDFYYDRVYNLSSHNDIPPTYEFDNRLAICLEIGKL